MSNNSMVARVRWAFYFHKAV